ncbi:MAG: hypothetical protein DWH79_09535 [Planctomycetota bacterium]|nr:MAG: hypothetical protein DWH79_09535 [Planctomycetota bacterium]
MSRQDRETGRFIRSGQFGGEAGISSESDLVLVERGFFARSGWRSSAHSIKKQSGNVPEKILERRQRIVFARQLQTQAGITRKFFYEKIPLRLFSAPRSPCV